MSNSRTKNVIINSSVNMILKIISLIIAFVVRVIFIRQLGVEYAGVSGLFTDILNVLSFVELGIGSAITYALYKPIAINDENQIAAYMSFYKKAYIIMACTVALIGACLIPALPYIIKEAPNIQESITAIYCIYILRTATSYLFIYKSNFLVASQQDYKVATIKMIFAIIIAIIEIVILLLWKNYIAYLCVSLVMILVQNAIISLYVDKKYPFVKNKNKVKLPQDETRRIFKDVRALFMYKVSGVVLTSTDSIIISTFIAISVVGVRSNYVMIISQLNSLLMVIFMSLNASVGNLVATSSPEAQEKVFNQTMFIAYSLFSFCACSLVTLINPFIEIVFGAEFVFADLWIVILLVLDFYIAGMLSPISEFRTANGLFVQGKWRPVLMSVLNIIISLLLVKPLGLVGIILGTILSRILTQSWYDPMLVFHKAFNKSSKSYFIKYILCMILMVGMSALTYWLFSLVNTGNIYGDFIIGILMCLSIPNIINYIIFHKTEEYKQLLERVKSIINKIRKKKNENTIDNISHT